MNTRPTTSSARRARFASMAAILLITLTASVVLLNVLAARASIRADVTATGRHQLSPRTLRVLESLPADFRVVIAAPMRSLDADALARVRDVLDRLHRASPRLESSFIDTGSATGVTQYNTLLRDLASKDQPAIDAQAQVIRESIAATTALADDLESNLSPSLLQARDAVPAPAGDTAQVSTAQREAFEQRAAAARITARDLRRAAEDATAALDAKVADLPLPATDKAAAALTATIAPIVDQLSTLAQELQAFGQAEAAPPAVRDVARRLAPAIAARRDRAAVLRDRLARLPKPDLLRVADALKASSAVLVINTTGGLTAIDPNTLFPPSRALNEAGLAQADLQRRAEELLSTALATLVNPARPIVVFVHAETRAFLDKSPLFPRLLERLRLHGIDTVEWPVVLNPDPPTLAALNPDQKRPVVYVSISPNTSAAAAAPGEPSGAERAAKLGQALDTLAQRHAPLLISINPSLLPGYGQPDPTLSVLTAFGLAADSGRPLLREKLTPAGRAVEIDQVVIPPPGDHPVLRAIATLPTYLTWPIPLAHTASAPAGVSVTDLAVIPASDALWAESQWLRAWQTPRDQLQYLRDLPVFDAARDLRGGPWPVAAAAERLTSDAQRTRLVVVGSNTWFTDPIAANLQPADGRVYNPFPGNHELFEAAVYWLCGQDDLIAQTPTARAFPMVAAIDPGRLTLLRWLIVAGLPLAVLALGALHRLLRG